MAHENSEFVDGVLCWTLTDMLDYDARVDNFAGKFGDLPKQRYESVEAMQRILLPHIVEEFRASLAKEITATEQKLEQLNKRRRDLEGEPSDVSRLTQVHLG